MTDPLNALFVAAQHLGSWAAAETFHTKVASAVPGLMTPDEEAAADRAQRLVPVTMSGPLADRGYAEVVDSPGAIPAPPPPANGHSYNAEERSIILRAALARMGQVTRDRADRDNLAAGGHLRIASAPWAAPVLAQPPSGDEGSAPNSATRTEYIPRDEHVDGFALADRGAGLGGPASLIIPGKKTGPNDDFTADVFSRLARRDAAARDRGMALGSDPLADERERKRQWGLNAVPDASWGPGFSAVAADPSAGPLSTGGSTL